jgi:glycosyltransferase involved in cell wall biosynthesis
MRDKGQDAAPMRILLVAENISLRLSGETVVPYHYLRQFLDAGHDVRVLCHARVRDDLRRDLSGDMYTRVRFVEDSPIQRFLFRLGKHLPYRVQDLAINQLITFVTQWRMRSLARAMIAEHGIDIVFQPAPIAAKAVSFMTGLGRPVVIGPMNGGMELPPAFRHMDRPVARWLVSAARKGATLLHRLAPGKLKASTLLVSNERTRASLPPGVRGRIVQEAESGVDFTNLPWRPEHPKSRSDLVSFVFCSRFVDWKGITYLVRAFAPLAREGGARLDLIGDGELFEDIRDQIHREGLEGQIILHGRVSVEGYAALLDKSDVFVTPSLRECGGLAMMEAMAVGLPIVGVDWGGAAQYTSRTCAILVDPASEEALVDGLTDAMRTLAHSADLRAAMGIAARRHLEISGMGWDAKADRILAVLRDAIEAPHAGKAPARTAAPSLQPHPASF